MIAVVLVGGEGTRLRPLTLDRPKPMLPIANRPFLAHLIERLAAAGVDRVIFSCGYLPEAISDALGSGADGGPTLEYVVEDEPLGTAGAIRHAAAGRVGHEPFLALNGDVLSELDLRALRDLHVDRGARATIALTPVAEPSRYGLVLTTPDGAVEAFLEKPGPDALAGLDEPYHINAGAYVLDPAVLELIEPGRSVSIERDVFPGLVGRGLYAHATGGYWNDIGTPESYLAANQHVAARHEPVGRAVVVAADARIEPGAELVPPVLIGAQVAIGAGARVGDGSVIGEAVEIGPNAEVLASVVLERARIGAGARVVASVVGAEGCVGEAAEVVDHAVLGPGAEVGPGERVEGERRAALVERGVGSASS